MAKRRLNRRQAWRIQKIQDERIARAERKAALPEPPETGADLGPEQRGLIIAHYGTQVEVEALEGPHRGQTWRAHLRANLDPLVAGDRVAWRAGAASGVIVARLPRRSELLRPDPAGALRPVAANIDYIIVVLAPEPQPHALMLDRYLVAAQSQGIEAIILLNKCDLLDCNHRPAIDRLLEPYAGIGYRVLQASTHSGAGIDGLRRLLADHTSVFTGQSGVGKSSLINALLPAANARTGQLSTATGKGRHTTTTAQLFHFPDGGDLIDAPGIRDFGLIHLDPDAIARGFPEFRPFLGHCKFRDCRHRDEPACALLAAVASGAISERRLHSYRFLVASLADARGAGH